MPFPIENFAHPYEHTINKPVAVAGVGLHSGVQVAIRLLPAESGVGVVFVRTDLDGFEIPANWKYVAKVVHATSLMHKGVLLSTTEHLLSVLYSMGIDNIRIEIDNLEVPILDGSGQKFGELLQQAGLRKLRRRRRYMRITKPVKVSDKARQVSIQPCRELELACTTSYNHPLVGVQKQELRLTPQAYLDEIAPARTFGFERDLATMRDMGLIRGASLDNAVCFGDSDVLNPNGLRFPDEPCRHKLLDLIGDIALLGYPLLGRVVAINAGHYMHVALVDRIMQNPESYEILTLDQMEPPAEPAGTP